MFRLVIIAQDKARKFIRRNKLMLHLFQHDSVKIIGNFIFGNFVFAADFVIVQVALLAVCSELLAGYSDLLVVLSDLPDLLAAYSALVVDFLETLRVLVGSGSLGDELVQVVDNPAGAVVYADLLGNVSDFLAARFVLVGPVGTIVGSGGSLSDQVAQVEKAADIVEHDCVGNVVPLVVPVGHLAVPVGHFAVLVVLFGKRRR